MALTRVDQYLLDTEISAEITANAVDVFIYDTSKDSDGGAWRKRTQHTSWYNETLNTATRGSRREFPAVAVIVTETDRVTIYDGDDPDLPMWMVFTTTGTVTANAIVRTSGYDIFTVSMLNGLLVCGVNYNGGFEINFASDECHRRNPFVYAFGGNVASRNGGMSFITLNTTAVTVNSTVNDVAMTVLPNAPIDPSTGLPVPTIAVATQGGVSVIKDDGSVVSSAGDAAGLVEYLDNNYLIITRNNSSGYFAVHNNHFTSETWNANANSYYSATIPVFNQSGYINGIASSENGYFGNSIGVHIYDSLSSSSTNTNGLFSNITSSYNTGWMHGDIKGAFLSDTDATNVTRTELVSNYDFSNGTTDWQNFYGPISASGGQLTITTAANTLSQAVNDTTTFDADKQYLITIDVASVSATGTLYNYSSSLNKNLGTVSGAGIFTDIWSGLDTDGIDVRYLAAEGNTITFNSISVVELEKDRSVNNTGLEVHGTITKSAVATGAELVAYRGFNSNNYLRSPAQTNHPFSFGTGDFSLIFWAKITSTTPDRLWYSIGDYASSSNSIRMIQLNSSGDGDTSYFYSGSDYVASTSEDGLWHQWCFMRNNGTIFLYKDSVLQGSALSTTSITGPDTYGATIGTATQNGSPYAYGVDYMSLFRISASAPSPEQIKKIYEDEKVLFQENAACTLYGSSDAVTALAYDEVTERLHVGTSSGRSDFQGLRRISNTTTPITTAISAHDGFIVEQ